MLKGVLLATTGVLLTAIITGLLIWFVLGQTMQSALDWFYNIIIDGINNVFNRFSISVFAASFKRAKTRQQSQTNA